MRMGSGKFIYVFKGLFGWEGYILKLRAVPRPCRELGVDRIRWNGLYSSDYCVADMYKKLEGKG